MAESRPVIEGFPYVYDSEYEGYGPHTLFHRVKDSRDGHIILRVRKMGVALLVADALNREHQRGKI